uniref:Uncharacterized protein n=1 Tax=Leersia perrieri TaxID=77586 RepID=A0A0D9X4V4_9ORYZ
MTSPNSPPQPSSFLHAQLLRHHKEETHRSSDQRQLPSPEKEEKVACDHSTISNIAAADAANASRSREGRAHGGRINAVSGGGGADSNRPEGPGAPAEGSGGDGGAVHPAA